MDKQNTAEIALIIVASFVGGRQAVGQEGRLVCLLRPLHLIVPGLSCSVPPMLETHGILKPRDPPTYLNLYCTLRAMCHESPRWPWDTPLSTTQCREPGPEFIPPGLMLKHLGRLCIRFAPGRLSPHGSVIPRVRHGGCR